MHRHLPLLTAIPLLALTGADPLPPSPKPSHHSPHSPHHPPFYTPSLPSALDQSLKAALRDPHAEEYCPILTCHILYAGTKDCSEPQALDHLWEPCTTLIHAARSSNTEHHTNGSPALLDIILDSLRSEHLGSTVEHAEAATARIRGEAGVVEREAFERGGEMGRDGDFDVDACFKSCASEKLGSCDARFGLQALDRRGCRPSVIKAGCRKSCRKQ